MDGNKTVIAALYSAFARGDVPAVLGALADDIEWTEAAGFPYGGTYHGPQAVLQGVFARLGADWEGFAAVPSRLLAEGDTVVSIGTYSGRYRATGKSFEAPFVHVFDLSGSRIRRFHQHTDTVLVQVAMR
jgi:ketosteroid isomerase-like protein